jgi:non-heme chloroperoxidase
MDHYAADASAVAEHLTCATPFISVIRPAAAKSPATSPNMASRRAVSPRPFLVSAVPPLMLKTAGNPDGTPIEVFDGFRAALAANRAQFFLDVASGPFYGFNRQGATVSQGVIDNWWRQGMMGSAKAHYDGIKAFSETDQTEDLKAITVPTLVTQGDDDQIVPFKDAAELQAKLLKNST